MNLLLFSDVHCSGSAVERLVALASRADVLVGAGDFGTMRRGTAETLAPFRDVDRPQVFVPGSTWNLTFRNAGQPVATVVLLWGVAS